MIICIYFWRKVYSNPLPIFNWIIYLFHCSVLRFPFVFCILDHYQVCDLWVFFFFFSILSIGSLFIFLIALFEAQNFKFWWCSFYLFYFVDLLEKTLESPLDCKVFQPVHSKGDQPWDFFGGNDAEAETPVLWPPRAKNWLIGEDFDAGRDWGQEEKGTTADEMGGWHHWLNGPESEWTPGVGDGQGGLACCGSWGRKESDTTEWLNWTELDWSTI